MENPSKIFDIFCRPQKWPRSPTFTPMNQNYVKRSGSTEAIKKCGRVWGFWVNFGRNGSINVLKNYINIFSYFFSRFSALGMMSRNQILSRFLVVFKHRICHKKNAPACRRRIFSLLSGFNLFAGLGQHMMTFLRFLVI